METEQLSSRRPTQNKLTGTFSFFPLFFSYPVGLLLIYYDFPFCFQGISVHVKVYVCASICASCAFLLALYFSITLFYDILIYFCFIVFSFLDAWLFSNERKQEQMWIWVNGEEKKIWKELGVKATIIRIYCMGKKIYFQLKMEKCKQSVIEKNIKIFI